MAIGITELIILVIILAVFLVGGIVMLIGTASKPPKASDGRDS